MYLHRRTKKYINRGEEKKIRITFKKKVKVFCFPKSNSMILQEQVDMLIFMEKKSKTKSKTKKI